MSYTEKDKKWHRRNYIRNKIKLIKKSKNYYYANRLDILNKGGQWRKNNPALKIYRQSKASAKKYGYSYICQTLSEKEAIREIQKWLKIKPKLCTMCIKPYPLSLDHLHNKVGYNIRGWICFHCNGFIGKIELGYYNFAIEYLKSIENRIFTLKNSPKILSKIVRIQRRKICSQILSNNDHDANRYNYVSILPELTREKRIIQVQKWIDNKPYECQCCNQNEATDIEHSHITGKIRGWVCIPCNLFLGTLEGGNKLFSAFKYLSMFFGVEK